MSSIRVHLIRHGEVENPNGVLYGRLDGFGLSESGQEMAKLAAEHLQTHGAKITRIIASPLQRTRESAAPLAAAFSLPVEEDIRLIEPWNRFEGQKMNASTLIKPKYGRYLFAPWLPSWGEHYDDIFDRMLAVISEAIDTAESSGGGDIALVSHQLPIWMVRRALANKPLVHNPGKRELALSSVTTVGRQSAGNQGLVELGYRSPAEHMINQSKDKGAV
ncbi:MAG: histidine phosphatase family protein [Microbacteriaceae bacterium]